MQTMRATENRPIQFPKPPILSLASRLERLYQKEQSLDVNAWVWAGKYGMWYRQMTRFVREGDVVVYDLCGNGTEVGTVVIDDYDWAPDLGIGDECPPPTNHPAAECRIPPCNGR